MAREPPKRAPPAFSKASCARAFSSEMSRLQIALHVLSSRTANHSCMSTAAPRPPRERLSSHAPATHSAGSSSSPMSAKRVVSHARPTNSSMVQSPIAWDIFHTLSTYCFGWALWGAGRGA